MKFFLLFLLSIFSPIYAQFIPRVEGYWESWHQRIQPEEIAAMNVHVIHIAFASAQGTGSSIRICTMCKEDSIQRLVSYAHAQNKKVLISLSGFNLTNSSQIPDLTRACVDFVKKFQLDGIELYFSNDLPKTYLQIAWIKSLRTQLGPKAMIYYTAKAIAAIPSPCHDVLKKTHTELTAIQLPAYNLGLGYHYEGTIDGLMSIDIPSKKVVLGLLPGEDISGNLTTQETILEAAEYVRSQALQGICLWTLNNDHDDFAFLGKDWATNCLWDYFVFNKAHFLPASWKSAYPNMSLNSIDF